MADLAELARRMEAEQQARDEVTVTWRYRPTPNYVWLAAGFPALVAMALATWVIANVLGALAGS